VESFKPTGKRAALTKDYKDRFQGLAARDVPYGEYAADVSCRETRIGRYVSVSNGHGFEVLSENRRMVRSDPPPSLLIRINRPHPNGETWWLTAQALYLKRAESVKFWFQDDVGQAAIIDPDPGSYVISVLSSAGYSCVREIDLAERTRLWSFDPGSCTFHVDAFAHIVTDEDKRKMKTTDWYRELRKQDEELLRALENAAKASPDSN
jgi:hypothetical protein